MIKSKSFNRIATIILAVLVCLTVFPVLLMVVASFTDETALLRNGYSIIPSKLSFSAYYYIVKQGAKILRAYGITILVTVLGTSLSVLITTMLAYPMSRSSFKYRNVLSFFVFLLCYLMVESYLLTFYGQAFSILKTLFGH